MHAAAAAALKPCDLLYMHVTYVDFVGLQSQRQAMVGPHMLANV